MIKKVQKILKRKKTLSKIMLLMFWYAVQIKIKKALKKISLLMEPAYFYGEQNYSP